MKLWIKDPMAMATPAPQANSGLLIEDGLITAVLDRPPEAFDEVFDASKLVVLPGLINGHHHFYQTLTRAVPAASNRALFPWLEALYPIWANLSETDILLSSQIAASELLLSGCTTAVDHHYLFSEHLLNATDLQVEAVKPLGLRSILCRGSMSLGQSQGGLPPDRVTQPEASILKHSQLMLEAHHDPSPGAMHQIALAPCSPFSVSKTLMRETAALAKDFGAGLHTHLSETHDENAFCEDLYGQRPLDYLEEVNWLRPNTWLAHGIHFEPTEIQRLGRAGVGITHCPSSNMILGSGICKTLELEAAGVSIGIGVDGSASNDSSNLILEARQALLLQRLKYGSERVSIHHCLDWATRKGALAINRPELGSLEPGKVADLAFFKVDEIQHSGHHDPLASLLLSGTFKAEHVMINGQWRVKDGCLPNIDLDRLKANHQEAAQELLKRL
ncbi:MAG: 8-oxoguanine deaminase [Gammaproteobacteria bacterium TMED182]|jgi:8-oxoguanine deaminase|nr:8-oxoguanine deaminase [Gammaproteobacteria bacterium]RPG56453.1 MAG: 8-oxoguanine deaminase [Gammaproteobacteria bacterium TMED182]